MTSDVTEEDPTVGRDLHVFGSVPASLTIFRFTHLDTDELDLGTRISMVLGAGAPCSKCGSG